MRSAQLHLDKYDTDKISNRYLERYDPVFESRLHKPIVLLELGIHRGGSLQLWHDYFPLADIVGVDITLPDNLEPDERIHLFQGSQADKSFLTEVANKTAPDGFDIIIDDASHLGQLSRISFWHLFDKHLKSGGLYVIEDWGTGYFEDYPDGRRLDFEEYENWQWKRRPFWMKIANTLGLKTPPISPKTPFPCHSNGMVGFIKQLVDEQGAAWVTRGERKATAKRTSRFERLLITSDIVFVEKA